MRDILNIINEARLPDPIKKVVDPAHLTLQEYRAFLNPHGESHPSSAYNWDVDDMNGEYSTKRADVELVRRVLSKGREFEFCLETSEPRTYAKTDDRGEYIRDEDNKLIFYTEEEIDALGYEKHEYSIHVFNDEGQQVGLAQDEWGCVLISVAKEYRGYRLGPLLGEMYMSVYPNKPSGGETRAGRRAVASIHKRFVTNAMRDGSYTKWVNAGVMTAARAKEIIHSVGTSDRRDIEAGSRDDHRPTSLRLMIMDSVTGILDPRVYANHNEHDLKKLVVAGGSVGGMNRAWLTFWGDTPKHRAMVASIEVSKGAKENYDVYLDHSMSETDLPPNITMDENRILKIDKVLNYEHYERQDRLLRRRLDPHEERTWEIVQYIDSR